MVFNPSFPYRFAHMVTACFLTTAFVVAGVSAWHLLRQRTVPHARIGFSMALGLIAVLAPAQLVIGDLHGLNTLEHQPAKIAAMEGHWETRAGAPLILFALPDQEAEANRFEIAIPKLGSLILTHELDGMVQGLKQLAPEDRPYVPLVFWSFRLMVGIGLIMIAIGLISLFLRRGGRLYETRWFLRICVVCLPIGFVALLAGWVTTEVGPPALGGLRPHAHGRRRLAGGDRRRRRLLARRLRDRLRADLPGRGLLHDPPGPARPRAARGGPPERPSRTARRPCPPAGRSPSPRSKGHGGTRASTCRCSGPRSSWSASSCTCCSTASISGSASCSRSCPRTRTATSP